MFGQDANQPMPVGSPTAQNPSMLDNVSSQGFGADDPAVQQASTTTPSMSLPQEEPVSAVADSSQSAPQEEHTVTSDNPFIQDPAVDPNLTSDTSPFVGSNPTAQFTDSSSPSAPVQPPGADDNQDDQAGYMSAITSADDADVATIDQDKLADMKRQALEHLEPLADHIDGTPEERFRTTMMMIQANDNHTLIEKALDAAKEITDDKMRAQAMLDIINEINYFSQSQTQ